MTPGIQNNIWEHTNYKTELYDYNGLSQNTDYIILPTYAHWIKLHKKVAIPASWQKAHPLPLTQKWQAHGFKIRIINYHPPPLVLKLNIMYTTTKKQQAF